MDQQGNWHGDTVSFGGNRVGHKKCNQPFLAQYE